MTMTTLAQVAQWTGGRLVGDGATAFERVHSDTRTLQPGDLFVALRGERFDAHDFLAQAQQAGAVAALAERGLIETRTGREDRRQRLLRPPACCRCRCRRPGSRRRPEPWRGGEHAVSF